MSLNRHVPLDRISSAPLGLLLLTMALLAGCKSEIHDEAVGHAKLFEEVDVSGIAFENTVVQKGNENVLNYPYYFNGGGVAIGDINNDGLPDIFFTGNQVPNKLYLNKGDMKFEDITDRAGVAGSQWRTGVTMADVNGDGFLDIYVCRSAMADSIARKNQLYVNNGDLTFTERAAEYKLDDSSYSTQAAFFDYDRDGDLDVFVLNHSLPQFAGFNKLLVNNKKRKAESFQSKLFKNDNGSYREVSEQAGLTNNVLSFGLGVAISDVNGDGWPDVYVSNDFNEEDYYYINQQNGTFSESVREAMGHVSLFSMGSDIADINNDALPDIYTLDMLPETNQRIKLSSGDDNYDKYKILIDAGFHDQTMRNMLQLNNGDGTFSEIGQLAGISNTDWSWATIFADFDNDGWKDLYVSNGYEKDYTNMQFLKFTVDEKLKSNQTGKPVDLQEVINQMPAIQVGNFVFRNNGDLTFAKMNDEWGLTRTFKSNGAACADLDNDGDVDIVINVINGLAAVYENHSSERGAGFVKFDLHKLNPGKVTVGTRITVFAGGGKQHVEFSPARGFQSAAYVPLHVGIGDASGIDSAKVVWPDGRLQKIDAVKSDTTIYLNMKEATERDDPASSATPLFRQTNAVQWMHRPPEVNDFKRQLLIPRMYSYTGPRIAVGDVDGDGRDDLYMCAPKEQTGTLFVQLPDGNFRPRDIRDFNIDKVYQDEDAVFFDVDGDGDNDLYVVSGGYMQEGNDALLQDRLYINDGRGNFRKSAAALPVEKFAGGCVAVIDANGDSYSDLFVGTRVTPGRYPVPPPSMLLLNDGHGVFRQAPPEVMPLADLGMVCDVVTADVNNDGKSDLVVVGEWTSPRVFVSAGGKLIDESGKWIPDGLAGWWNTIAAADFDGDGDVDLIAGNAGENNQYGVSGDRPMTLVYKDFNSDGEVDPFINYFVGDKSYPYASRDEALGQVGSLRPRFPDYNGYAIVTLREIFTTQQLEDATELRATELRTRYLENTGNAYVVRELPIEAQFAPVHAVAVLDVDDDADLDVILAGNETHTRVRIGKSDANYGVLLLNDGKGQFTYVPQRRSGFHIKGDVRDIVVPSAKGARNQVIFGVMERKVEVYRRK